MYWIRRSLVIAIGAVLLLVWTASPGHASFPQTARQTIAGPGMGSVTSSDIPPNTRSATFDVQPQDGGENFDDLVISMANTTFPKLQKIKNRTVKAAVGCQVLSFALASISTAMDPSVSGASAQKLFMRICLELAFESAKNRAPAARAGTLRGVSAQACRSLARTVRVSVRWTGGTFTATQAKVSKPKARPPLVITCKPKGRGVRITLKPRSKKKKLRSIVGNQVGINFANATDAPVKIRTTISVT